jgi:hypothetical protein
MMHDQDPRKGARRNGVTRPPETDDQAPAAETAAPKPRPRRGSFIPAAPVAAARRRYNLAYRQELPVILGLSLPEDIREHACIIDRNGPSVGQMAFERFQLEGEDPEDLAATYLCQAIDAVAGAGLRWIAYVDTSVGGAGVADLCLDRGYDMVRRLNLTAPARDRRRYADRRAEIWDALGEWVAGEETVSIPDDAGLHAEICGPVWRIDACRLDKAGRLAIEARAQVRARLGRTPTAAEALACTFADPIGPGYEGMGPTPVPPCTIV